MTSFYDKTGSLMRWCRKQELPPEEACEILLQRLLQAKEYLTWVGQKAKMNFDNPQELDRLSLGKQTWERFCILARALKINVGGKSFWDVAVEVLEKARSLPPDLLYNARPRGSPNTIWDLLWEPFGILHIISHDLKGRYSDSPYSWTARIRKGTIRDSDQWLKERYPDAPPISSQGNAKGET